MKKIKKIIISLMLAIWIPAIVNAEFVTWYVNVDNLNCRTMPSMQGEVIKTYSKNTPLQIIGGEGWWLQTYDGKTTGWCYGKYMQSKPIKEIVEQAPQSSKGKLIGNFRLSYYTCSPSENGGYNTTAKGQKLRDVVGICIAADPKVIPYYSKVYIEGIGVRTVLDCGGAIKGNKIDILVNSRSDIPPCGISYANVYLLD